MWILSGKIFGLTLYGEYETYESAALVQEIFARVFRMNDFGITKKEEI